MSTNTMTIEKTETKKTKTAKTLTERRVDRKAIYNKAFQEMEYLISKGRTASDALAIVTRKYRLYAIERINLMKKHVRAIKRHIRAEKLTYVLCQAIGNRLCSRWSVRLGCSTAVDEETTTYGHGHLDDNGFWQFPVSSEVVGRKRRREAIVRARNEKRRFEQEIRSLVGDQSGKFGETLGSLGLSKVKVA